MPSARAKTTTSRPSVATALSTSPLPMATWVTPGAANTRLSPTCMSSACPADHAGNATAPRHNADNAAIIPMFMETPIQGPLEADSMHSPSHPAGRRTG